MTLETKLLAAVADEATLTPDQRPAFVLLLPIAHVGPGSARMASLAEFWSPTVASAAVYLLRLLTMHLQPISRLMVVRRGFFGVAVGTAVCRFSTVVALA